MILSAELLPHDFCCITIININMTNSSKLYTYIGKVVCKSFGTPGQIPCFVDLTFFLFFFFFVVVESK